MNNTSFPGFGRKRPQLNIPIERLHLDGDNPRLPAEIQGKAETELLRTLYREFDLDKIAESMSRNGYFDEEPLVTVPQKLPRSLHNVEADAKDFSSFIENEDVQFTVVEGNRRLATIKLLLDPDLRQSLRVKTWPELTMEIANDLRVLPVIVYVRRKDVIPYLGVRHIVGLKKWDSYAKARYVASMIKSGFSIDDIEAQIGDDQGAVIKSYLCYQILEQAKDEGEFDVKQAQEDFSLLLLAIGQGNVKNFLGLPKRLAQANMESPVPHEKLSNLQDFMIWIFGANKRSPVIKESRDITNFLSHIVASLEAITYLNRTGDLEGAYDRTDGEEKLILKYLMTANTKLEGALGMAHRHKIPEVVREAEKCEATLKALLQQLKAV
jgi:hypothetical protein